MTDPAAVRAALASFLNVPVKAVDDTDCPITIRAMERAIETYEIEKQRLPDGMFINVNHDPYGNVQSGIDWTTQK